MTIIRDAGLSFPKKMCSCGCGEPMEPRVDGQHLTVDGLEVNPDCYYGLLGEGIEEHPTVAEGFTEDEHENSCGRRLLEWRPFL